MYVIKPLLKYLTKNLYKRRKKMKRTLIFLLAGLLLASCAPASGDETTSTKNTPTETEAAETVDPATLHDLPEDLSFDGANFHILSSHTNPCDLSTATAEYSGVLMNDVRYDMTQEVMKTLGVTISEETTNVFTCVNYLQSMIASGDTSYDCINFLDRFALESAVLNLFIPLQDVKYIDLTKDYWGEELSKKLSINNTNYFAIGSYQLGIYNTLHCVLFNNKLAADNNITIPFDDVDNGTWTFDKLASYKGIATVDTDGDGEIDQWTYSADERALPMTMVVSSGYQVVSKDENDKLQLNVYTDMEPFVNVLDKVRDVFYTGDMPYANVPNFASGKEMICFAYFALIGTYNEMEDDFSILPVPKYDETQQQYYSRAYDSAFTGIPTSATDTDKSGAVLECLNSYGYRYLLPAFIETTMQDRVSRDPRSAANIELIYKTRTIELGEAFLFNRFGDSSMVSMVRKSNVTSFLEKVKNLIEKDFNDVVGTLS